MVCGGSLQADVRGPRSSRMWVVEHVRRVAAYAAGEDTVRKAEESSSSSLPRSPEAEADADAQRDDGGNNRNGARYEPQSVATTLGVRNREAAQREKLLRVLNSSTVSRRGTRAFASFASPVA